DAHLDHAFAALADPTRRAIIQRLAKVPDLAVLEIAAPFAISLPGVIKHLDVLARARLIERTKVGRSVRCRLSATGLSDALNWLSSYQRFWTQRLDALALFVEKPACPNRGRPISRSRARSKPRRAKYSPPGRGRAP